MPVTRRRVWLSALVLLVIARSVVFVFWAQSHFDADQGVFGLMAKHLSEHRAFPVFLYGQIYLLGVESWLAAPVMAVLGPTVTALKLPMLAINVAITCLLFTVLARDGVKLTVAAFASLFFVLAAPMTAAHFVAAAGGNVEPLLYVLLLWMLRGRPVWMGLVLGLGFLQREFTVYGAAALVIVDALDGRLLTRAAVRRYGITFTSAALVWVLVWQLQRISSVAGPGTTVADLSDRLVGNNLLQITRRLCLDPWAIAAGFPRLFTSHLPELFGLEPQPLTDAGIESTVTQGLRWSALLLVPALGLPLARLIAQARDRTRSWDACRYLTLVGVLSLAGYLVGRCGLIVFNTMRYELLSPLAAAGIGAWFASTERSRTLVRVWALSCTAIFALSAESHARLVHEYVTVPPRSLKMELVDALETRGIRYGYSDFWTAYYVDFMTRERVLLTPDDVERIHTYHTIVAAHRDEAVRISRRACEGGEQITPAFWICRVSP